LRAAKKGKRHPIPIDSPRSLIQTCSTIKPIQFDPELLPERIIHLGPNTDAANNNFPPPKLLH
jgi:hypothetical protein